jgi:hypothetical protein
VLYGRYLLMIDEMESRKMYTRLTQDIYLLSILQSFHPSIVKYIAVKAIIVQKRI